MQKLRNAIEYALEVFTMIDQVGRDRGYALPAEIDDVMAVLADALRETAEDTRAATKALHNAYGERWSWTEDYIKTDKNHP